MAGRLAACHLSRKSRIDPASRLLTWTQQGSVNFSLSSSSPSMICWVVTLFWYVEMTLEESVSREKDTCTASIVSVQIGHRGRIGKLRNQSTALEHARMPVLLLSISVRANITYRKPGVNTRPRLMAAKVMSPADTVTAQPGKGEATVFE